jgi:signal transduction histidine kinase
MEHAVGSAGTTPGLDRRKRIAIGVGSVAFCLLLAGLWFTFLDRSSPLPQNAGGWNPAKVGDYAEAMGACVLGTLIAVKRPSNMVGWLFLVAVSSLALTNFGQAYAARTLIARPGSLPGGELFGFVSNIIWGVATAMLILLLLVFPTGSVLSRRWRLVAAADIGVFCVTLIAAIPVAIYTWRRPFYSPPTLGGFPTLARWSGYIVFPIYLVGVPVLLLLALISVVLRFRRSRGDERLQLKWFTFVTSIVVCTFIANTVVNSPLMTVIQSLALLGLWVAIAIALLKYRLYDIDVVIRKTVVGAVLVAFITIVYAILVAGIGALGSRANALKSGPVIAAATAIVAIAFQPVLRRARRLADQLVYGKRATPYEVLSEFSDQMGETYATDELPQRMARILAEGTGATNATVWLHVGAELRPTGLWPADASAPSAILVPDADQDPGVPEAGRAFAVRHHGELLGALSITMPPDEPLNAVQEKLCSDLAAQAGLVLRNVRLIEELRASRQRLVAAQDEERRKLERNIHDGAQQQLVALSVKLRLLGQLAKRDPDRVESLAAELQAESTDALENLRDLARGIYPPLLADQGLIAALESQARKSSVPVTVKSDEIGRRPQDVEAAVYFCCLEALQNIAKYAEANSAIIRLSDGSGALTFEVTDDGRGFDPASTGYGTGLQGMADRLDALGGSLDVRSAPDKGTTIVGKVPGL